jgi:prepilin-type N-terminal cleavage/methylation domain-containing protein
LAEEESLRRPRAGSEAGFSLAEILVTIAIVGITFTALLGGMVATITVSSLHRKQATADTVARDGAEWVKDSTKNPYSPCAGAGTYGFTGLVVPNGYSVTVTSIEYWNGTAPVAGTLYSPAYQSSCPGPDAGLQRITIAATSSDGQATETVQVLKRIVP